MQAISNFCTALSAQNLNASVDKIIKIEEDADNTSKISADNLYKSTKELFSGERNQNFSFHLHFFIQ